MKARFKELQKSELDDLLSMVKIAIITVTEVEKKAFYNYFMPLPDCKAIIKVTMDKDVYYIGRMGVYNVLHIHSGMGSVGTTGSILTVNAALQCFPDIQYCIMGGIAFGIDEHKQKKGDVLVSECIIKYDCVRVCENYEYKYISDIPHSSIKLYNLFSKAEDWNYGLSKNRYATIIPGKILSGEKLIDDLKYRKGLKAQFPKAIGGEMEGTGLASACSWDEKSWIVVKSIADWANGKKNKRYQPIAADVSFSLIYHVLSTSSSFSKVSHYRLEDILKDQQEWMMHASKGSPLWTINQIRSSLFSHLIKDLSQFNDAGYDESICNSVKKDLMSFADEIRKLPKIISENYLNTSMECPSLEKLFDDFFKSYTSWNDVNGEGEIQKNERIKHLNNIKKARRKLATEIRINQRPIGFHCDKMNLEKIVVAHKKLSEEHSDTFPELQKAVNRMLRKMKKVGMEM